jgi:hypothetical protein
LKKLRQIFKGINKYLLLGFCIPILFFLGYSIIVVWGIDEGTTSETPWNLFVAGVYSTLVYPIAYGLQFVMEFNIITIAVAACIVGFICALIIERIVYLFRGGYRNYQHP